MRPVRPVHRDPAPSRWAFRMQRWILTPTVRVGLRFGLPLAVVITAGVGYLADQGRRDDLTNAIAALRTSVENRPEFMVRRMSIAGAGTAVSEDILDVVPIDFPISSFDLDLEQIREIISGLDPVREASVRIRPGGVLLVEVTERVPAVVWRSRQGVSTLDETGAHVDVLVRRSERSDLPLIAGEGADAHVGEALRLIAAAEPLGTRLRGLVRMGERRWDIVLDRGQRILLPTERPVRALERVIALSEAQDLLERDVAAVDMRIAERPTVRMTQDALQEMWRIRKINDGEN